jgi:hypothetical protein
MALQDNTSRITAGQLRDLAQYVLAASVDLQRQLLDPHAESLLEAWMTAAYYLGGLLHENATSRTARATRRVIGMMTRPQLAHDEAAMECQALLESSDALKNQLADGDWEEAAEVITRAVLDAYHAGLEKGQS